MADFLLPPGHKAPKPSRPATQERKRLVRERMRFSRQKRIDDVRDPRDGL